MSRGGSSWRTGSPDRLNALLENQTWDPVLMFGGRRPPTAAPAPPPAAPPPPPPPAPPSASGFVAPEWCAQPRGARTNAHLLVWRGAALVETIPVGGHAYLIAGRLPECGIVLEHGSASRQHAALLNHRSGATYVMDLGSAHGTFLSGRRLPPREPTLWEEGAACVFGASSRSYVLRLSAAGPLAPPPSAGVGSSSSSSVQPAQPPSLPVYHPTPAVAAGVSTGAGVAAHAAAWQPNPPPPQSKEPGEGSGADRCFVSASADGRHGEDEWSIGMDDSWMGFECEANTRHNLRIPVDLAEEPGDSGAAAEDVQAAAERAKLGRRLLAAASKSVSFDPGPPSVRFFEPASPEPIYDPEGSAGGGTGGGGSGGSTASAAPASLPRPKCVVTTTKRARFNDECSGQFAHLASTAPASASTSGVNQRLATMYGEDDPPPPPPPGEVEGTGAEGRLFHKVSFAAMERAEGALFRRARASAPAPSPASRAAAAGTGVGMDAAVHGSSLDVLVESLCGHTYGASLLAKGACLSFESSAGSSLVAVHFAHPELNPISDGRVHLNPISEAEQVVRAATVAPRRRVSAGVGDEGHATVMVSIVNPQDQPILVYASLLLSGDAGEVVLTPWEGVTPLEEQPASLSVDGPDRGANCLLLAPLEGTPGCEADEAETAPFGESNTFRYAAATGVSIPWPSRESGSGQIGSARLRIEASYQQAAPAGSLGDGLVAEAPFLVAVLPLVSYFSS